MNDKNENTSQGAEGSSHQLMIALAGNPNAGKTTLFNALTGSHQRVSNYPGNTVERIEGVWKLEEIALHLIDLPGLYNLDTTSDDQTVARKVLQGEYEGLRIPDAVIAVVDATNLKRNLYLVTELLECRIPLVVALTMFDDAEKKEINIEIQSLSKLLNTPVVAVTASTKRGLAELEAQVLAALHTTAEIPSALTALAEKRGDALAIARNDFTKGVVNKCVTQSKTSELSGSDRIDRILTNRFLGLPILLAIVFLIFLIVFSVADLPMQFTEYGFFALGQLIENTLPRDTLFRQMVIDGIIAGVGGIVVFVWQIALLFLFISILEDVGYLARATFLLDRIMRSFGLNGKAFMPLFSSFACAIPGIMATRTIGDKKDRLITIIIAPLMSCSARIPVYILLIPLMGLSAIAGAFTIVAMYLLGIIVAILVAFVLKRTALKAPLPPLVMELPPYRLPNAKTVLLNIWKNVRMFLMRAGTVIFAISIILWALQTFPSKEFSIPELVMMGIAVSLIVVLMLRRLINLFKPKRVSIRPLARNSAVSWWRKPGWYSETRVVALAIILWALVAYFPIYASGRWNEPNSEPTAEEQREQVKTSLAGKLGRIFAPAVRPLGIGVNNDDDAGARGDVMRGEIGFALIASFAAREVFVSAWKMSSLGSRDADPDPPLTAWNNYWENFGKSWSNLYHGNFKELTKGNDEDKSLQDAVTNNNFTPLNALTLMVFFVLAMQCASTLAVVWRETNSWWLPILMFFGMTVLAYVAAFLTYQGGRLLSSA
jgi:ferrous iron transport protein B